MTPSKLSLVRKDRKVILSIIWVFVLMNMIYADIFNTMKPSYLAELEYVSSAFPEGLILLFAIFMEIPIIMIPLAGLLDRKHNRLAHYIAVPLSILWVVVPSILSSGTPMSYLFFATIEVIAMLLSLYVAWSWPAEKISQ